MTDLVSPDQIEQIVGARRHTHQHLGRAVSAEQTVYVLHSEKCRDSGIDLRECEWSLALDRGIDLGDWSGHEDRAVVLAFRRGRLFPVFPKWLDDLVISPVRESMPMCDVPGCGKGSTRQVGLATFCAQHAEESP